MRRRTLLILLAVAVAAGGAAAWNWQAGVRKALETAMSGEAPSSSTLEEAVGVAMKGIELVQGEKGIELWRLKATWAQLRQSNNIIDVDKPDLVYQMDGGKQVRIVAQKGEVQQQVQLVRMWDDVHATHERHELFASLMLYNGTSRTMYFPEGARMAGQSMSGNATKLEWDVAADVLRGSDGVSLLLMPRADEKGGQSPGQSAVQPLPAGKADGAQAKAAAPKKDVPRKDVPKKAAPVKDVSGKTAQPKAGQAARKASAPKAANGGASASKPTKQETRQ